MKQYLGSALVIAGAVAGYVTGMKALDRAGLQPVPGNARWMRAEVLSKDSYAIYARGHFRSLGLLPPESNAHVYLRDIDDEGNGLRASCSYLLRGPEPAARWWAISVMERGNAGFVNALTARDVIVSGSGQIEIPLTQKASPGNWLSPPAGSDGLTAKLVMIGNYPDAKDTTPALPDIKRMACE